MWSGGVRVVVPDGKGRILMVCQEHEGKQIWMLPGGGIEDDENAIQAAEREVFEETGLRIAATELLWHVEEVSPARGQRFVNYFLAEILEGTPRLGSDPEFGSEEQVLRDLRFLNCEELSKKPHIYPEFLREEVWSFVTEERGKLPCHSGVFKIRDNFKKE